MRGLRTAAAGMAAGLAGVMAAAGLTAPVNASNFRRAAVVDGDTIRMGDREVRLIGYDTPERGQCGYEAANAKMRDLIEGGVRLVNISGTDRYGRTLAYVETDEGWDVGTVILRAGLAVARYDSRDGYDWHPKEDKYRRIDSENGRITCKPRNNPTPKPEPTSNPRPKRTRKPNPPTRIYYPNCTAVKRAGAAPLYRGQPGYSRRLDRDGDGVACEP